MNKPAKRPKLAALINRNSGLPKEWFTAKEIESFQQASLVVLALIATAGIALVSIAAPNALKILTPLFSKKNSLGRRLNKRETEIKTAQVFYYLKRSGLINLKSSEADFAASLTKKGLERLARIKFNLLKPPMQKLWNKKWWQVAADIPTKDYRIAADMFRKQIKQMGFYSLQRTLWFYPFDPRIEIQTLAEYYGIQNFVTIMEISRMDQEDENNLIRFFQRQSILKT